MSWFLFSILSLVFHFFTVTYSHSKYAGSDFAEMVRESVTCHWPFVDKTMLIKDFVKDSNKLIVLTRPRRWGKSVNIDMIYRFLSIEMDNQGNQLEDRMKIHKPLFNGGTFNHSNAEANYRKLKISHDPEMMRKQGTYPTLRIDFSKIIFDSDETITMGRFKKAFSKYIGELLHSDYEYLITNLNKLKLDSSDEAVFRDYVYGNATLDECQQFFSIVIPSLYYFHNDSPIYVLIDEYDVIMNRVYLQEASETRLFSFMMEFFVDLFKPFESSHFSAQIEKVLMTGILPYLVTYNRSEADRSFNVYSVADEMLSNYYGFTKQEVEQLVNSTPSLENRQTIVDTMVQWYGGYECGSNKVLKPWSVSSCLHDRGKIDNYFKITEDKLDLYLRNILPNEKFDGLMEWEEIPVDHLNANIGYLDLNHTEAVLSPLLHNGLVTIRRGSTSTYKIPNNETLCALKDEMIRYQLKKMGVDYERLPVTYKNAAAKLAEEGMSKFEKELQKILQDFCKANVLPDERVFYWFMKALLIPMSDLFDIFSERKIDVGRCGQRIIPKNITVDLYEPMFILEYRHLKTNASETNKQELQKKLISTCKDAIDQTKKRNYTDNLPVGVRPVYYIGVAASTNKELRVASECFSKGQLLCTYP